MCKELMCLTCLLAVFGISTGTDGATMVARWRLDNDAVDSVGDIDGTLINGPEFTTDAMVGSHALALDASAAQYIDFGNPQGLPAGRSPRSMAGWGKTNTVTSGYRWMAAYGTPSTSQAMFIGMLGSTLVAGGYGGDDVQEIGFWDEGVWHHICLTYDGSVAKLYADGVEVDSQTKNWNLTLDRAHIGRQVNDAAEFWDGLVDDVRIYDYALSPAEIRRLAALTKATKPDPPDGAIHPDTWVTLSWTPGGHAVSHDVYLGDNLGDVNNGTGDTFQGNQTSTYFVAGFPGFVYPDGLVPGTTYYWRIDEVNETDPNSPWRGDVWSFTVPPKKAYNPNPADGARYIALNPTLSWTAGFGAKLHTVYFGLTFDEVNNAAQGAPAATTTYVPGARELDTTYYWRVDEFDAVTTHKGDVWNFRTMPDIPIQDPNLVCWWKLDEGQGVTVLDWSGHDNHGTLMDGPQWVNGYDGGALAFDGSDDYVNFSGASDLPGGRSPRSMAGWARTDSIAGGWRWIAAYGSAGTGLAMFIGMNGTSLYGGGYGDDVLLSDFWEVGVWHHICLTYDGAMARLYADGVEVASETKTWNLALSRAHIGRQVNDLAEFWDGLIDDVRIYNRALTVPEIQQTMRGDPLLAWNPSPADGTTTDVTMALPLRWSAGDKASEHDVYFGIDRNAIADAGISDTTGVYRGRQSGTVFSPSEGVEWNGGPYYWRIDEHNADGTVSEGRVWNFTVADYLIVDDIESYNDLDESDPQSNRIYLAWIDGFGTTTNGSVIGNLNPPFTNRTDFHGGTQSMPYFYDNNFKSSQATLTLTRLHDWTIEGVEVLSLWFKGATANAAEPMYVALNDGPVVYHNDPDATQVDAWTEWTIDLQTFADQGVDLTNVGSITIGFGTPGTAAPGGAGNMLFDDIRLYRR